MLLAAGATAIERRYHAHRRWIRHALLGSLIASGLALGAITLPVLPLPAAERALDAALGRIVTPVALTHDMRDEHGWPALVEAVADVYHRLPPDERATATTFTRNYGQAAAIDFFGARRGLPRATSGHLTYHVWGPDERRSDPILVVGDSAWAREVCPRPQHVATFRHPLAMEDGAAIHVCRDAPPLAPRWDELAIFRHGLPDLAPTAE